MAKHMKGMKNHNLFFVLLLILFQATASSSIAEDKIAPPPPEEWPEPIEDYRPIWFLLFDRLEYDLSEGPDTILWDVQGWVGSDYNKLWIKTEGDQKLSEDHGGDVEVQALYSRLISPFWYLQIGGRFDTLYGNGSDPSRGFGVIGFEGLAPYWYDVETALFVSQDGDVSARLEAEYELLFTQRLIAQPRFETNIAIQQVEKFGVGEGFNDVELGLRLRYEIRREFAPYIGISWTRLLGDTADIARNEGEEVDNLAFVAGVRMWF
jgi:copper resistance protein B